MRTLSIDIETYSCVDLTKTGVYPYVESDDFEILLFAYAFDDDNVKVIDLASGEKLPDAVKAALWDSSVIKNAYNANFELTCLSKYFGEPLETEQWQCTMVHAAYLGLPGSLGAAAEALNLPQGKMDGGKRLIEYFSKPCKPTLTNGGRTRNLPGHSPDKWEAFKEYCRRDVDTEREIKQRITFYKIPDAECKLWFLDQKINTAGIEIDKKFVTNAIMCNQYFSEKLLEEAGKISGLVNPGSPVQIKKWLERQTGSPVKSIDKDSVGSLLASDVSPEVKRFLSVRRELAKTSVSKYTAMDTAVCKDGRLRGSLQFYGANRTGRWGGRIVQPHNLPRNYLKDLDLARNLMLEGRYDDIEMLYGNPADTLSQLVRTAFVAGKGKRFIVSDFSAIEARVIAWLAGEKWRMDVFKTHGKIYEASAAQMFKVPIESVTKGSDLRQRGKVAELALGYQGGPDALVQMGALDMGLDEGELPGLVSAWRNANQNIVSYWYDAEEAAVQTVKKRTTVFLDKIISFFYIKGVLFIELPSGRRLSYLNARVEKGGRFNKERLLFDGSNQTTKKWETRDTYGGKLTENIVQAVARDCLAQALLNLDEAGYKIVLHVHDEVVIEAPEGTGSAEDAAAIMSRGADWAKGLPLSADAYETFYYRKD